MFDRSERLEGPIPVEITLTSGRQLTGKVILPSGRTLAEALNGPSAFIEFEPEDAPRSFIAKAALERVTPLIPKPANVNARAEVRTTEASPTAQ
jgi:hypothetical protein